MTVDLVAVAARALARPVVAASIVTREPLAYDPFLPGRSVDRVEGWADIGSGSRVPWSAIVKRTAGVALDAARRELAAYRLGIAPVPGVGATDHALVAPALLAWHEADDSVELWLELLDDAHAGAWPVARFAGAAADIARWDAAWRGRSIPPGFEPEPGWAARHGQPHRLDEALGRLDGYRRADRDGAAASALGDAGFRRTASLIASTPERIGRLDRLPRSLLHHDLVRSNLFAVAPDVTAAIDWEVVGLGPLGVDLAPLVVGSVRRGEAAADDLPAIEAAVLDAYIGALRGAGIDAAAEVRLAYRESLGLRWHVVLGAIQNLLDPAATRVRGSRPDEPWSDAVRHLAILARHLLSSVDG